MSKQLGNAFVLAARAPLQRAAGLFCAGKVPEGLAELDVNTLRAALGNGAEVVGRAVGLSRRDVEPLLPGERIADVLGRLSRHREAAMEIWATHGHRLGGFLAGVAEVTMDAERHDDAGFYLDRLADKLSRDGHLARPLDDLAGDVTEWDELLKSMGPLLQEGPELWKALYRKRLRWAIGTGIIAAIAITSGYAAWSRYSATKRIEGALAVADPCQRAIAPEDLDHATTEHMGSVAAARAECDRIREAAEYDSSCAEMIERVKKGELTDDDRSKMGTGAPLLERARQGDMTTADLLATPTWPCSDRGLPDEAWRVIAEGAVLSPVAWRDARSLSKPLSERIGGPDKLALSKEAISTLTQAVEPVAERAVLQGRKEDLDQAKAQCSLMKSLELPWGTWCTALDVALRRAR